MINQVAFTPHCHAALVRSSITNIIRLLINLCLFPYHIMLSFVCYLWSTRLYLGHRGALRIETGLSLCVFKFGRWISWQIVLSSLYIALYCQLEKLSFPSVRQCLVMSFWLGAVQCWGSYSEK